MYVVKFDSLQNARITEIRCLFLTRSGNIKKSHFNEINQHGKCVFTGIKECLKLHPVLTDFAGAQLQLPMEKQLRRSFTGAKLRASHLCTTNLCKYR